LDAGRLEKHFKDVPGLEKDTLMPSPKNIIILLLAVIIGGQSLTINAQQLNNGLPIYTTKSVIDGAALSNVHGRITVNMAAGDSNRQINTAALAINQDGGLATAISTSHQVIESTIATPTILSTALIDNNAFANSVGAISINQTSGALNSQANGLAFALGSGVESVSASELSETNSGRGLTDFNLTTGIKTAKIANTAFVESRGLIQINQSAGSKNKTANNFTFQLSREVNP
jgi:hypothetical protein